MKRKFVFVMLLILIMSTVTVSANFQLNTAPVLVMMYHRLSNTEAADAFTIAPETFESDIKYLAENGYTFCTASELDAMVRNGVAEKAVALTFDDGYKSDVELALPILEKYNAKATFFIIGEMVGTGEYMSEEQIKKLAASPCVEIGNHSYSLHNMEPNQIRKLYFSADISGARDDFLKNKEFLEQITGKTVRAISYPLGLHSKYFDAQMKADNMITFSSVEQSVKNENEAYGRFNRAFDISIEDIVYAANLQTNPQILDTPDLPDREESEKTVDRTDFFWYDNYQNRVDEYMRLVF